MEESTVVGIIAITAGVGLIAFSSKFAQKAITGSGIFARANAKAGKSTARMGPIIIGSFLALMGVLMLVGAIGVR